MLQFLFKRVATACVILLMISVLTYGLIYLAPGDPALLILAQRLGHIPSATELAAARSAYGLDRPVVVQYMTWLMGMLRGDFGRSLRTDVPAVHELLRRGSVTLLLTCAVTVFTLVVGIAGGFLSVVRTGSLWDHLGRGFALASVSIPTFWLAFLFILVFSVHLRWLPAYGMRDGTSLVLPTLSIGIPNAAYLSRLTRSLLLDVGVQDYLRTARAKGLSDRAVWLGHALPNIALPLITLCALQSSGIAAGSVIVETVFAWPGLGSYFVTAVEARDIPAIQATVLWFATIILAINLLADVLYSVLDPRIRFR